jgi:hypothetical protein
MGERMEKENMCSYCLFNTSEYRCISPYKTACRFGVKVKKEKSEYQDLRIPLSWLFREKQKQQQEPQPIHIIFELELNIKEVTVKSTITKQITITTFL